MQMRPVKSSNVKAIGYSKGDMVWEFQNGTRYLYEEVPTERYADAIKADLDDEQSVGKFFHKNIRGGYTHRKLTDKEWEQMQNKKRENNDSRKNRKSSNE